MRLELRWATADYVTLPIGEALDAVEVTGMADIELAEASKSFSGGATISAEVSSQGKGASGPAIAIVVEIERFATDTATLIGIGTALFALIRRVRARFSREPVVEDLSTLGALAAAAAPEGLTGHRFVATVPVTALPGVGTNDSDIWASCFKGPDDESMATVVFMSPSGLCLGAVKVPAETYRDGDGMHRRNAEDLRRWWSQHH